eukprot:gene15487-12650_t
MGWAPIDRLSACLPHRPTVASRRQGRDVRKWDGDDGRLIEVHRNLAPSEITALCLDDSGRRFYVGMHNGGAACYVFHSAAAMWVSPPPEAVDEVLHVCFIPDSPALLALSADGTVRVFPDDHAGACTHAVHAHAAGESASLAVSAPMSLYASSGGRVVRFGALRGGGPNARSEPKKDGGCGDSSEQFRRDTTTARRVPCRAAGGAFGAGRAAVLSVPPPRCADDDGDAGPVCFLGGLPAAAVGLSRGRLRVVSTRPLVRVGADGRVDAQPALLARWANTAATHRRGRPGSRASPFCSCAAILPVPI